MAKDGWDKAEVVGKVAGALLIPTAVAFATLAYNWQVSQRASATEMIRVAVGILRERLINDFGFAEVMV